MLDQVPSFITYLWSIDMCEALLQSPEGDRAKETEILAFLAGLVLLWGDGR